MSMEQPSFSKESNLDKKEEEKVEEVKEEAPQTLTEEEIDNEKELSSTEKIEGFIDNNAGKNPLLEKKEGGLKDVSMEEIVDFMLETDNLAGLYYGIIEHGFDDTISLDKIDYIVDKIIETKLPSMVSSKFIEELQKFNVDNRKLREKLIDNGFEELAGVMFLKYNLEE